MPDAPPSPSPSQAPPPPVHLGERLVVPVDVGQVQASVTFDRAAATVSVEAVVDFALEECDGYPALDLRQPLDSVRLDGVRLPGEAFSPTDLGGGPGAEMRVLDRSLARGSRHRLELRYRLATPAAQGAEALGWIGDAVRWDFWMSDLHPGRYLEMWLPANLSHDRFQLKLKVAVEGGGAHQLITNGTEHQQGPNEWQVEYPATFTSLSPMLVLRPRDEIELRSRPGKVELITAKVAESDADLDANEADIAGWLEYNEHRYGPWVHGNRFTTVLLGPGRGMEYDGATTASVGAVEHEVFHSWFGRGIKPWRASDGWIDEAWTSWATNSRRRELGRFAVEELSLEEPAVLLYPPSPWSRHTPVESYREGARLFAGVAYLLGGAPEMRQAMADWYRQHAGGFVTTTDLERHLSKRAEGVAALFARYVHGRERRE
ncbi:MAG: hypothetical protein M3083_09975 [Actinomycetota bacterium]|nr:hypothetical protein [Actinomycetota bacterium]